MKKINNGSPVEILLVEDNLGDIMLVEESLKDSEIRYQLNVIKNGEEVMDYLKHRNNFTNSVVPDLILLDLNLPRKNGKEVLSEIKNDNELDAIPVIILTSSQAENDILDCYKLKANSYLNKPVGFDEFVDLIKKVELYWIATVTLPPKNSNNS